MSHWLCVMVCTCWVVCHDMHVLGCVSWYVRVGLSGVHLFGCVSRCALAGPYLRKFDWGGADTMP